MMYNKASRHYLPVTCQFPTVERSRSYLHLCLHPTHSISLAQRQAGPGGVRLSPTFSLMLLWWISGPSPTPTLRYATPLLLSVTRWTSLRSQRTHIIASSSSYVLLSGDQPSTDRSEYLSSFRHYTARVTRLLLYLSATSPLSCSTQTARQCLRLAQ